MRVVLLSAEVVPVAGACTLAKEPKWKHSRIAKKNGSQRAHSRKADSTSSRSCAHRGSSAFRHSGFRSFRLFGRVSFLALRPSHTRSRPHTPYKKFAALIPKDERGDLQ